MKKFLLLILLVPHYLFAEDLGYWNWTQFSTKIDDARLSLFVDNRFQDRTNEHSFRFALFVFVCLFWGAQPGVSSASPGGESQNRQKKNTMFSL